MNIGIALFALAVVALATIRFLAQPRRGAERLEAEALDPRLVMQIVISLVILAAGLWVILSKTYEHDTVKWAYGAVGIVIGFWLKA